MFHTFSEAHKRRRGRKTEGRQRFHEGNYSANCDYNVYSVSALVNICRGTQLAFRKTMGAESPRCFLRLSLNSRSPAETQKQLQYVSKGEEAVTAVAKKKQKEKEIG